MECVSCQFQLESYLFSSDPNKKFPSELADHLAVCSGCKKYKTMLIRQIECSRKGLLS